MPAQYYFDELDPTSFQRLINALLVKRYGEGIRLLPLRGRDGGRDAESPPNTAYFTLYIPGTEAEADRTPIKPGRYLFQVKHHRISDRPLATVRAVVAQDFSDELLENVLPKTGIEKVDYFFLITNVPSSRDAVARIDEKRRDQLKPSPEMHADVLWQEHITAWLDQTPTVWAAYPELFAGRVVPTLGQISSTTSGGLPLSIRLALTAQMLRDSTIRFRQINLEQRLAKLFVDLDARSPDFHPRYYLDDNFVEMGEMLPLGEDGYRHYVNSVRTSNSGALALLTSESQRQLSKVILEGGPGQGKSTVTQMLTQIYRSVIVGSSTEYESYSSHIRRARIPIRIELRLFAEWLGTTNRSIEQYVAEIFSADAGGAKITVEDIQTAARNQEVLLICDGLDEVGSDTLRDEVVSKIVESVSRLETAAEADLRVIVTSRPPAVAGRLDALSGFRRIQLQPLDDKRVGLYVKRWTDVQCIDATDRTRVNASFSKRRHEEHVAALIKNPMQLSVLLHFIRLKGEAFPDKRAELYREYFKTVIDRDVEKSPELRHNRDDIETLHEVMGFTIHSRAEGTSSAARLTRTDLIALVRKWFLSEGRNADLGEGLFKIGEERLGLIVALSGEGESTQYGFEIQPVREYFAAAFINDKCEANAHDLFEQMMRRPFWREVARFLAGLRRANERADLLSRARQLDNDPIDGWRSDGLAITYQLLQEGVLTTPGHVHRDALSFLISTLEPTLTKVRVQPKGIVNDLPRLIMLCDNEQPRQQLAALLKSSKGWEEYHELHRLWSVCNRVLTKETLLHSASGYEGDFAIQAAMKIRWPIDAKKNLVSELDQQGKLDQIPTRMKGEEIFYAVMTDPSLRTSKLSKKYHRLILEQFAFWGISAFDPVERPDSNLAIWSLQAWLIRAGATIRNGKATADGVEGDPDVDGLSPEEASVTQEIIRLLKSVATSSSDARRRATKQLLSRLLDLTHGAGLAALIASRCSTTLLGYVEGRGPYRSDGRLIWDYRPGRTRAESWTRFRKSLLPLFRAAFPEDTDRAGRTLASRLVDRGFYRALQSTLTIDGEAVEMLTLLSRHREGVIVPEWVTRAPVNHYWIRSYLNEENAKEVLEAIAGNPLDWSGPFLPLTQEQVSAIAKVIKKNHSPACAAGAIFALQGSKMWGKVRERTLSTILSEAPTNSPHWGSIFNRGTYSNASVPQIVSKAAENIVTGKLHVPSAISAAAAQFLNENTSIKLPRLRELEVLPTTAKL